MKKKIIGNVDAKCEYCKHGKIAADNKNILCPKMGVTAKDYNCKKFSYDPLKRIPSNLSPQFMQFEKKDFEI